MSSALAAGYVPGHISGVSCWCRPRAIHEDGGTVWVHRQVILLPDTQHRAFQSVLLGPPT